MRRNAADGTSPFAAFTALQRGRAAQGRTPLGIQSLELGVRLLKRLADAGAPMRLRDLAAAVDMSPSKAHRYLASFCRTGLVSQDEAPPDYRLGPYAVELGARALAPDAPVRLAAAELEALAAAIGHTVALAVWGTHGPTIVLLEESAEVVTMNIRPGTTAPLLGSASGLVFAAYLPHVQTQSMLAAELAANRRAGKGIRTKAVAARALSLVREHGCASVKGALVPGVAALAVPVFDHRGRVVVALLAVGRVGDLDTAIDGAPGRALRACAGRISRRLGAA